MKGKKTCPIKEVVLGIYDGPHATPKESLDGPIYLGIKNITEDGRLDFSETRFISEQDLPRWTRRVAPQPRDIVFTYEASLHRYAMIPDGFRGCLGRRTALVRPDESKVDSRFLLYYFLASEWRAVVEGSIITGATVDRIPLIRFPDFPVCLPDLPKQRRIASVLSAFDDLIQNNLRRIALLEKAAQMIYEEWFVRLQFPGHEHAQMIDGLPEGWQKVPVPSIVDVNPRTTVASAENICYIPMAALSETSMLITFELMEDRTRATGARFQNGDVLFPRITPCLENGKTGFVNFLEEGKAACGSTEFIVLRGVRVGPPFVYCMSRTYPFRENAIKSMIGSSGRQRVQTSCFEEFYVLLPGEALLREFEEFTSPLFNEIRVLHLQNQKLKQARDLLLPRFMSGEIAV